MSSTSQAKRNPRGQKFTRLAADHLFRLQTAMETWDLADLRAVDRDLMALSTSNCAYYEFRLRNAIREVVHETIAEKEEDFRRAARILETSL